MGTNYYLEKDRCQHCKRGGERLHIGKSSGGWCFSLHVIPEDDIHDLSDWQVLFANSTSVIVNEYGDEKTKEEMMSIITERRWRPQDESGPHPYGYASWEEYKRKDTSIPGPNNLRRHRIDGRHCIGHGEGTWDLIVGEFS